MDSVMLIVAALATGAAAGTGESVERVVVDAYEELRELIVGRHGIVEAEVVGLESDPAEPLRRWLLAAELAKTGAGDDAQVRVAAEDLLRLVADFAVESSAAIGVEVNRIRAGGDIEITDVAVRDGHGVSATDVRADGSIRISGIQAGSAEAGPRVARR